MTLAQQYAKKIEEGTYMEHEVRETEDCIGVIWPGRGDDSNGYWLDVFIDGSAIECCPSGEENVLTAAETKQHAGRWASYKEIKNQIKTVRMTVKAATAGQ